MEKELFIKYATVLMEVVAGHKVVEIKYESSTELSGISTLNDTETMFKVNFKEEYNTLIAHTSTKLFSFWRIAVEDIDALEEYVENNTTFEDIHKPLLTREELVSKLEEGKMEWKIGGHFVGIKKNNKWAKDEVTQKIINDFKELRDGANGVYDNTWDESKTESKQKVNKYMRDFYKSRLERPLYKNKKIVDDNDGFTCSSCGSRFDFVLKDAHTIGVYPGFKMKEKGDLTMECKHPNGPPDTSGTITINSDIVIANFFLDDKDDYAFPDSPKDKEYSSAYDLCTFAGRRKITAYKAAQNTAYGQMGNMGMSVWVNKSKDHIIFTEMYRENLAKDDYLYDMDMEEVGDISLSVWRWEATDAITLEKRIGKTVDEFTKLLKKNYKDVVSFDVKHGKWKFVHYYDTNAGPIDENMPFIYSELKLVPDVI